MPHAVLQSRQDFLASLEYETRVKLLYSETGLYVLMNGSDTRITATMTEDFLDLWNIRFRRLWCPMQVFVETFWRRRKFWTLWFCAKLYAGPITSWRL